MPGIPLIRGGGGGGGEVGNFLNFKGGGGGGLRNFLGSREMGIYGG